MTDSDPNATLREKLRAAIGAGDAEDEGLEHWHQALNGSRTGTDRFGVFVDRGEVLAVIDELLA